MRAGLHPVRKPRTLGTPGLHPIEPKPGSSGNPGSPSPPCENRARRGPRPVAQGRIFSLLLTASLKAHSTPTLALNPQGQACSTPWADNFFATTGGQFFRCCAADFFVRKGPFSLTKKRTNGKVGNSLQSEKVVCGTVFDNQAASNWQLGKAG
jgi:hypothetical protein